MTNRNKIYNFAITFPQSGEVTRQRFLESFPPSVAWICAMELHEDGNPHLHLGIVLKNKINKLAMLKWIKVKWPNDYKRIDVQATRSIWNWGDYLRKEDAECLVKEKEVNKTVELVKRLRKLRNMASSPTLKKMFEEWLLERYPDVIL